MAFPQNPVGGRIDVVEADTGDDANVIVGRGVGLAPDVGPC